MNNKQTPDSGFTKLRDMTIKELSMQMVKDWWMYYLKYWRMYIN